MLLFATGSLCCRIAKDCESWKHLAARKALPKKRGREGVMDAESMGLPGRSTNAGAEPMRALADAGMVLRDPSTMYLIIHHVWPLPLLHIAVRRLDVSPPFSPRLQVSRAIADILLL